MKIVYYYVLYLKNKKNPQDIEMHLYPFKTEKEAKEYEKIFNQKCGERFVYSKIKKVDLSKHEKGYWL